MNIIQVFADSEIRFVDHPENKFDFGIIAADMARILDLDPAQTNKMPVDSEWKSVVPVKTAGGEQLMTVIWEPGVRQLLTKSRKPKAKEIAVALGLIEIITPAIEAQTIRIIKNAFAHLSPVEQFFVSGYRIDLYFPDYRIAIECDEKYHLTLDQSAKDIARQDAITAILGCRWIRYKPDAPSFCIGNVINQIMQAI